MSYARKLLGVWMLAAALTSVASGAVEVLSFDDPAKEARYRALIDELRCLVRGESATAALGFSGHAGPVGFYFHVYGENMTASAKKPSHPRPLR